MIENTSFTADKITFQSILRCSQNEIFFFVCHMTFTDIFWHALCVHTFIKIYG